VVSREDWGEQGVGALVKARGDAREILETAKYAIEEVAAWQALLSQRGGYCSRVGFVRMTALISRCESTRYCYPAATCGSARAARASRGPCRPARQPVTLQPNWFLNQRENALTVEKPSKSETEASGRSRFSI